MQTVHIETTNGTADCDDCGFYDYGYFTISFSDGTVLRGNHDGHLGGGNWDGHMSSLYLWTLEKLGYSVTVNGDSTNYPKYRERAPEGTWPQWVEPELFNGVQSIVDIKLELIPTRKQSDYEYPGKATVPSLTGDAPLVFRVVAEGDQPANWDGDLMFVWRAVLDQVVHLTIEQHIEDDEEFDEVTDEAPNESS